MIERATHQDAALGEYLLALDPPDLRAARRVVAAALDSGMAPDLVVETVIRPAQQEIGRRWYRNQMTVAQEHAATAITDSVLELLASRPASGAGPQVRVVTCCVEGEWHTMPPRMLGVTLAASGHDVTFLGPPLAAARLERCLNDIRPVVALLSCTNPINLPGARRSISVAHDAGVAVIIGGAALDAGGVRAKALGADACAADAAGVASVLACWAVSPPAQARPAQLCAEGAELEVPHEGLVADCLAELLQRRPTLGGMTSAQLDRTREDIAYILQFCSAALITRDQTLLDQFTMWLRDLLAIRNVPSDTIRASYDCIGAVLGGGFPTATRMLARAARSL